MMKKIHDILVFSRKPARKEATRFNGALLDQKREDAFAAMHQIGLFR